MNVMAPPIDPPFEIPVGSALVIVLESKDEAVNVALPETVLSL